MPATRDKFTWPFASTSIWNMPIGASAVYVKANIPVATTGIRVDEDQIVLVPTAPATALAQNGAGWTGADRCPGGALLATVPIPTNFLIPNATHNNAGAIVLADGHTVVQGQPLTRCLAGGPATVLSIGPAADLYGDGILGSHGGSRLSSLGGTIRLGELIPGAPPIRHVLKINLYAQTSISPTSNGYRWPAIKADACWPACYGGAVSALRMGALLAIPPSVNLANLGLETAPAKALAWTLQNYGAYVVDDTARQVYAIEAENGPAGSVVAEFGTAWGFPMNEASKTVPWGRDADRLYGALSVVDNNSALSVGGGGAPLQPLAPPIGN